MQQTLQSSTLQYDLAIVTLPRSGSHMLGTALGSHPDINFCGEFGNAADPEPGKVNVVIVHCHSSRDYINLLSGIKCIGLVRSEEDRIMSLWKRNIGTNRKYIGAAHYSEPTDIHNEDVTIPKDWRKKGMVEEFTEGTMTLDRVLKALRCLVMHYEELSGDKDIRSLPDSSSKVLCDLVGVPFRQLIPTTYKPNYLGKIQYAEKATFAKVR